MSAPAKTTGSTPTYRETTATPNSKKGKPTDKAADAAKTILDAQSLTAANQQLSVEIKTQTALIDELKNSIEELSQKILVRDDYISELTKKVNDKSLQIDQLTKSIEQEVRAREAANTDIFQPTTSAMTQKLTALKQRDENAKLFRSRIDDLRSKLQILCETKNLSIETLETDLDAHETTYHSLAATYLAIKKTLEKETEELSKIILEGTHKIIPEEHKKAFSAYNDFPQATMEKNKEFFDVQHAKCIEQKSSFEAFLSHYDRRFGDISGHLNELQKRLDGLKKEKQGSYSMLDYFPGYSVVSSYLSRTFHHPNSPYYKGQEEVKPA